MRNVDRQYIYYFLLHRHNMFILLFEDYIQVIMDEVDFAVNEMMVPGVKFVQKVKHKADTEHAHATEQDVIDMETEDMSTEDGNNNEGEDDAIKSKNTKWVCTLNGLHNINISVYAKEFS